MPLRMIPLLGLALLSLLCLGCDTIMRRDADPLERDERTTARVKVAMHSSPGRRLAGVSVHTVSGRVHLGGVVPSIDDVTRAVLLAGDVRGVHSVRNDLRVQRPGS